MRVIPVLDLQGGIAVHARGGERRHYAAVRSRLLDSTAHVDGDVIALAHACRTVTGGAAVYVADLDAITGRPMQWTCLAVLAASGADLWVDAGVTSVERARQVAALPSARVIVGLETLHTADVLAEIASDIGKDRLAFSLDLRAGVPVSTVPAFAAMSPTALAEMAVAAGASTVIALDLARVGSGTGLDLALIRSLRVALPGVELVVGGGVGSGADLAAVAAEGVQGVLVASALHDGRLTARDIQRVARPG